MLSYGRLLVQFIRRLLVGRRRSLESRARLTSLNYVESVTENRDLWFVIGHVSHLLSFLEYSDHFASRSGGELFFIAPPVTSSYFSTASRSTAAGRCPLY